MPTPSIAAPAALEGALEDGCPFDPAAGRFLVVDARFIGVGYDNLGRKFGRLLEQQLFPQEGGLVTRGSTFPDQTASLLHGIGSTLRSDDVVVISFIAGSTDEFDAQHIAVLTKFGLPVVSRIEFVGLMHPGGRTVTTAAIASANKALLRRTLLKASNTEGSTGVINALAIGSGTAVALDPNSQYAAYVAQAFNSSAACQRFLEHAAAPLSDAGASNIKQSGTLLTRAVSRISDGTEFGGEAIISIAYAGAADMCIMLGLLPPGHAQAAVDWDKKLKTLSVFRLLTRTDGGALRTAVLVLQKDRECYAEGKVLRALKRLVLELAASKDAVMSARRAVVRKALEDAKAQKRAAKEQSRALRNLVGVVRDGTGRAIF